MMRRLINRIQGKRWGAECPNCHWNAGRTDLKDWQAKYRAKAHSENATWMDNGRLHAAVIFRK